MSKVQEYFMICVFTSHKDTGKIAYIIMSRGTNQSTVQRFLLGDRFCRDLLFVLIYPLHGVDALLLLQPLDEVAVQDRSLNVLQRKLEKVCLQGKEW